MALSLARHFLTSREGTAGVMMASPWRSSTLLTSCWMANGSGLQWPSMKTEGAAPRFPGAQVLRRRTPTAPPEGQPRASRDTFALRLLDAAIRRAVVRDEDLAIELSVVSTVDFTVFQSRSPSLWAAMMTVALTVRRGPLLFVEPFYLYGRDLGVLDTAAEIQAEGPVQDQNLTDLRPGDAEPRPQWLVVFKGPFPFEKHVEGPRPGSGFQCPSTKWRVTLYSPLGRGIS